MTEAVDREALFRSLGLTSVARVFHIVKAGAKGGPGLLLRKRLVAPTLERLGYDRAGMWRLGVRVAGFSVRDLLNFGHNENHIVTAGYSIRDLVHEGPSTRVVDRKGFHNA